MLRSKRTFAVALALALGVLAMAVMHSFGLLPSGEDESQLINSAAGRHKPRPTSGQASPGQPGTSATDDLGVPAGLIPTDACIYLEVSSFAAIERVMRDLVGPIEPGMALMFDGESMLNQMLASFGGSGSGVDRRRPMGVALAMPENGEPRATLLLPVHAPEEFARGLRLPPGFAQPRHTGRYVGLTLGPDYPVSRSGAPIATGLEPATISGRFQLDPVRDQVLSAMDLSAMNMGSGSNGALAASLGADAPLAYQLGQDFAYEMVSAMDHIDLALDLEDETTALHFALAFNEGSKFGLPLSRKPADLGALARFGDEADDVVAVAAWDSAFVEEVVLPFVDDLGDLSQNERDEANLDQLEGVLAFAPNLGDQVGLFADFEVGAAHLALVCRPQDPDSLLGMAGMALAALNSESAPVSLGSLRAVELENGRAARLTIDLSVAPEGESGEDARTREMLAIAFGSEQVVLQLTSRGGWLLVTLSSNEEWREGLVAATAEEAPAGDLPAAMADLLARIKGASPGYACSVDLLSVQRNMLALMSEQMGLDASNELLRVDAALGTDPLPISFYGAVHGGRWSGGAETDLKRVLAWSEMFAYGR
jgi:hypothetical protein